MGFSAKQVQALRRQPDSRYIRTREANGREFSYLEGWYAISEANRIFGFDGWSRETVESRCVLARENRGTYVAVYVAKVRITVQAEEVTIVREGHGTGESRANTPGEVHDTALKAAETDATKRALATFGRPFGLALYGNGRDAYSSRSKLRHTKTKPVSPQLPTVSSPDDMKPVPPCAPRQFVAMDEGDEHHGKGVAGIVEGGSPNLLPDAPLVPAEPSLFPSRIDKSALPLGEPKRRRDKAHLRFVASQPCLICGRQPSDAHHLRFAQPRALGLKVSDEFTVPLCRGHHRLLHQAGNEAAWWEDLDIDALEIAKGFWEQSRGRSIGVTQVSPNDVGNSGDRGTR